MAHIWESIPPASIEQDITRAQSAVGPDLFAATECCPSSLSDTLALIICTLIFGTQGYIAAGIFMNH